MGGKENHNKSRRDIAVLNRVGSEGLLEGSSFWRMGGSERAVWIFWESIHGGGIRQSKRQSSRRGCLRSN